MESGINLPTRDVVLYDVTLPLGNGKFERIGVNTAWQRAGRAGRSPGQTTALIHVFESGRENARPLLDGHFEPLDSPLGRSGPLLDFILGSLDGGYAQTRQGLIRLTDRTFAAHQGQIDITGTLGTLLLEQALEEQDGRLSVTPLGRIASQALLCPATLLLRKHLAENATLFDVLMLASRSPDLPAAPRLEPSTETWVQAALDHVSSRMLDSGEGKMTSPVPALIAQRTCEVGDSEAAAELDLDVPSVSHLRNGFIRVLTAWNRWRPGHLKVQLALTMLAAQLPLDAATLALIPGIGQARARWLASRGVPHLEALAQTDPDDLTGPGLSRIQAGRWVEQAEQKIQTWTTDPTREPAPGQRDLWTPATTRTADPLRLRRATNLNVTPGHVPEDAARTGPPWEVTGGATLHMVDASLRCDCLDWRPTRHCKHALAVLLHTGDHRILKELDQLQREAEEQRTEDGT